MLIPAQAQQIGQQGPFVYVVTPDSTAELAIDQPGQRQGDLIVVEQGVQPGEKVIVTGHMTVMPTARCMIGTGAPGMTPAGDRLGVQARPPHAEYNRNKRDNTP